MIDDKHRCPFNNSICGIFRLVVNSHFKRNFQSLIAQKRWFFMESIYLKPFYSPFSVLSRNSVKQKIFSFHSSLLLNLILIKTDSVCHLSIKREFFSDYMLFAWEHSVNWFWLPFKYLKGWKQKWSDTFDLSWEFSSLRKNMIYFLNLLKYFNKHWSIIHFHVQGFDGGYIFLNNFNQNFSLLLSILACEVFVNYNFPKDPNSKHIFSFDFPLINTSILKHSTILQKASICM